MNKTNFLKANHVIKWTDKGLEGNPIFFEFEEKINPETLKNQLMSGEKPFEIWGKEGLTSNHLVCCVDLRSGSIINFEVFDDSVGMYVYEDDSVQSILRFYENLKANYKVKLISELE